MPDRTDKDFDLASETSTTGTTASTEAEKRAALRRTKAFATISLALCVVVFLTARSFSDQWPWLSFVAAFAEAAAIGGIADWYAVVALFRRPLGLPIPHTAIIPRNQARIADNLGRFIEANFLERGAVRRKLEEIDFSKLVADWLGDPRRADALSGYVVRLAPQALDAIEKSELKGFVAQQARERLDRIDLAPFAAQLLASVTADGRHQRLLDRMLEILGNFLNDAETLDAIRDRIRHELPTLARFFRADAYLLRKIVASAGSLIEEVGADPDHAVRREFDTFVQGFIERLRTSRDYRRRAERIKRELLDRPEIANLADDLWSSLREFVQKDAASADSLLRRHLALAFGEVGRQLEQDERIRAEMNDGFVVALSDFVEAQKSGVASFISEQVRGWDLGQLTRLIELNIGRDLQYIRFNGMLVGGIAGLLLHSAERLFFGG